MRAAVITKINQPWELKTLPDPHPQPGQVVIKIHASGMCAPICTCTTGALV